jgi:serine/threonine-protein kinase
MGSVYEVEHTELGKRFVLKALLSDLSRREDLVARLRNEQRALGRLEHPNIINVTDAGVTSSNIPYFVMERLEGETLGARLKRTGYVPIGEALAIASAILDGLAAAHEIGVVHRDVKPPNVFLVQGTSPKILDFGVAKVTATGGAITARGVAVGTPRYMSPEQASGENVDGRSDIYAVGLLLYESILGKGPFDDIRDANELLLAHLSRPPARLSTHVGSVTHELDAVLGALLAKKPAERPATAREAAARLRAVATPYAARPETVMGYAQTVRLRLRDPVATTRADGIAARKAWSVSEATTEDEKTLLLGAGTSGAHDTLIDAPPPSGGEPPVDTATLEDLPGASLPTRTEILTLVDAAWPGDVETHTLVPADAKDGAPTLAPVPLAALPAAAPGRSERKHAWLAACVLAVALGVAWLLARPPASSNLPRSAPALHAQPVAAEAQAVTLASAAIADAPGAPEPMAASMPSERSPSPVSEPSSAAPPLPPHQKSPKRPKQNALSPHIPDGLPTSGL